ncbi:MAG: hypothetical protein HYX27_04710 [Acidobacteria bacterium]|nr:hypothetical protein [Acidobacteriota bacterium]
MNTEQIKGGRELVPGQSFDLTIPVGRPGRVTIFAIARRHSLQLAAPAHYLVGLHAPGAVHPVAVREVKGPGLLGILEHDVKSSAGLWTARITNINSHPLQVTLEASYPGIEDLHVRNFPAHFLEAIASRLFAETAIHLHHGRNACVVRFAPALGLRDYRFTLPSLNRRVSPPLLPELDLVEQVNDISSNAIRLRLLPGSVANPGGTLRLEVGFEEDGEELIGSFPVHLARMKLLIELDLGCRENRISFNNVRATFDVDVDIQPLPVWMYNPIFDFQDRIQESVRAGVRSAFEDVETCHAITCGFERGMETVLGSAPRIATLQLENGQVWLGLFRAAKSAVA